MTATTDKIKNSSNTPASIKNNDISEEEFNQPFDEFDLDDIVPVLSGEHHLHKNKNAFITSTITNYITRKRLKTFLLGFLIIGLLFFFGNFWHGSNNTFSASKTSSIYYDPNDKRPKSFNITDVFDGTFAYYDKNFAFIRPPAPLNFDVDPGLYYTTVKGSDNKYRINVKKLADKKFLQDLGPLEFEYKGKTYQISEFQLSFYLDKMLIATDIQKKYRHSSVAHYWLKDMETSIIEPITLEKQNGPSSADNLIFLRYADFSPRYNFVYFVDAENNDLHMFNVVGDGTVISLTNDGSVNVLNGVTDWVYEEEVLATDKAVWWSPNDDKIVFIKLDDTNVEEYVFPKYISKDGSMLNEFSFVKYPRPGGEIPKVTLLMFDLKNNVLSQFDEDIFDEPIIYNIHWVDNVNLLVKMTNRISSVMATIHYFVDPESGEWNKQYLRTLDAGQIYDGWIERQKKIINIPNMKTSVEENIQTDTDDSLFFNPTGYTEIQPDDSGYDHIFYYPNVHDSNNFFQLTKGDWEVQEILGYDQSTKTLFFTANEIGPMSKHLYAVIIDALTSNPEMIILQNPNNKYDYCDFILSSSTRFGIKKYLGPNVPQTFVGTFTELYNELTLERDQSVIKLTVDDKITDAISSDSYDIPRTAYKTMLLEDNVVINYIETLPPKFNHERKHPLLINVYGGPGSNRYTTKFNLFFESSVSSSMDAIILQIEPRGTGNKGWNFKRWAKGNLGYWEPRDIVAVTKKYIEENRKSIDEERVAIWGWSYGGFTTLKTLEFDKGELFKYGVAVAPVTDWTYYDSIYTERYLGLPDIEESNSYEHAIISDFNSFRFIKKFLIVHGTADDNVHIANTYSFLDHLIENNIMNYDLQIFPDSDHSISFHNGMRVVYTRLFNWIGDAFNGKYDR
ncbi:related to Dipeptidyl aminopeptidase A [Saccharomycodes ludwigii]|uniref:Related to Dipeptidyl aminopeptidase A n=1 Tax=Saccharomycodes ludwigii TaxID=36035 RepID=A0A376B433_9ASCO|nr:related to Dipeptidyl aminopeptidase A [Saccharomycodes ludwigii]